MYACRKRALARAIQLSILVALPAAAAAQAQNPATGQSEARTLDTVRVTGSRIKRADVESQVPLQAITREDIDRTGLTSLGDTVQALSASGLALNTKFNASGNFGFPTDGSGVGAGSAQVALRHLGSKRVLGWWTASAGSTKRRRPA